MGNLLAHIHNTCRYCMRSQFIWNMFLYASIAVPLSWDVVSCCSSLIRIFIFQVRRRIGAMLSASVCACAFVSFVFVSASIREPSSFPSVSAYAHSLFISSTTFFLHGYRLCVYEIFSGLYRVSIETNIP